MINIVLKDWREHHKTVFLLTAGMFLAAQLSRAMMTAVLIAGAYTLATLNLSNERQRSTLQLLLALPMRPYHIVLAKYASLYSMILVVNVPAVFLRDLRIWFLLNAVALSLSTLSMAATVICKRPWAPIVPLWATPLLYFPGHCVLSAFIGLAATPVIVITSAIWFEHQSV